MTNRTDLENALAKNQAATPLNYGTAGFRGLAETLPAAMFRCGVLAALRSYGHSNQATGVMVTASHNPGPDNGVKLVDPDGSMLSPDWEAVATPFVNAIEDPLSRLSPLVDIDAALASATSVVIVGCDTRESSPSLMQLVVDGAETAGAAVVKMGVVTTPQLHFAVRAGWQGIKADTTAYFKQLKNGFSALVGKQGSDKDLTNSLVVDCANGVGAAAIDAISELLPGVSIINRPSNGPLNEQCGADFVQKKRAMPTVYSDAPSGEVWASLDGDADRLVLFRKGDNGIVLADGDRFAALVAQFVSKHLKATKFLSLTVAVAQTAYSNGAATELLSSMEGVEVVIAKTGVKHLEKAVKPFDIGIYWEPNGHGTVLFSEKAIRALCATREGFASEDTAAEQLASVNALLALSKVANQAVGDGVADLLLIIGVLSREGLSFDDWLQIYDERCSNNMVVRIADKAVVETTDCDRVVVKPEALRDAIAKIATGTGCRAFVRPSGTEDVVRVYAEAPVGCEGKAHEMAVEISRAVFDHCAGVGNRP